MLVVDPIDHYMNEISIKIGGTSFLTMDDYISHIDEDSLNFHAVNGVESEVQFKLVGEDIKISISGDWGVFTTSQPIDENQKKEFIAMLNTLRKD